MLALALLFACGPADSGSSVAATTGPSELPLPEVAGIAAAEDHDPDPQVVEVHLTASKSKTTWIEGTTSPTWAYNDQVPGPLIQARVGDTLRVIFTNDLDEPTTIHWHGLRIDNEMDGVPAVQDPVQPGDTFTYEFVLPEAGSYWYHPHVRGHEQVERGLHGPLVVHEAEPPVVDKERYFVLDDVLLEDDGGFAGFGLGGMTGMHGRFGNYLLANGRTELLTDTVRPGAVERWRVVNTANARLMYIDVTGADWRVVGVDGGLLEEPYTAKNLELPIGRRFDLEVVHREGETSQLRVLIPSTRIGFDKYPMFEATVEGEALDTKVPEWPPAPLPAISSDVEEVELTLDAGSGGGMRMEWVINGLPYDESQPIPVSGSTPALIHLVNLTGMGHPFHLHGQFFEVVSRNGGPSDVPGPLDTVWVNGYDELDLYTTFDNPGLWMAHCHILEHAELGMMTSFEVDLAE